MTHDELRESLNRIISERLNGGGRELWGTEIDVLARLVQHEMSVAWFETRQAHDLLLDPRRI